MQASKVEPHWSSICGQFTWSILAVFLFLTGCGLGLGEWKKQEAIVKGLIEKKATREEAIAALGTKFYDYSVTDTNREAFLRSLQNDPQRLVEVRDRVKMYPNVLFYSTPDIMTWVFLNESNIVVDYHLMPQ